MHIGPKVYFLAQARLAHICCKKVRNFRYLMDQCEIEISLDGKETLVPRQKIGGPAKETLLTKLFGEGDQGTFLRLPFCLEPGHQVQLTIWDEGVPYFLSNRTY